MRKHRFFINIPDPNIGDSVTISPTEANHIKNSLRLEPGDTIYVFNGEGEFKAELTSVRNDSAEAKIIEISRTKDSKSGGEDKSQVTVFLSLIKANNFELALQKITELGAIRIIPLLTDFSVVKVRDVEKKLNRWEKIVIAACKQSERIDVPEVSEAIEFKNLKSVIDQKTGEYEFDKVLFFTTAKKEDVIELKTIDLSSSRNIAIVIGPEGGFSPNEEKLAREFILTPVSIGENILKAETAAIVATALVIYESSRSRI